MRRKLPAHEIDIGKRLRKWREERLIPRTVLAKKIGITNERLASYERGVAPLKWSVFAELHRRFSLSPQLIATGIGPEEALMLDFERFSTSIAEREKFSVVYERSLAEQFARRSSRKVSSKHRVDLVNAFIHAQGFGVNPEKLSAGDAERGRKSLEEFFGLLDEALAAHDPLTKNPVDSHHRRDTCESVQSAPHLLQALLDRVRALTAQKGAKAALARELGISRAHLSSWLSHNQKKVPSAENALRLLNWVEWKEAKKQTPPVLLTPKGRKTQAKPSANDKQNSGPPHK